MADEPPLARKIKPSRRSVPQPPKRKTSKEVQSAYTAWSYSLSLFSRLPTELLIRILGESLGASNLTSPNILSQVCRIWADVIANSPILSAVLKFPMTRKAIQMAVARAKDHPLTIDYWSRETTPSRQTVVFMEETSRHIAKWKAVKIWGATSEILAYMRGVPAPLLEWCDLLGWRRVDHAAAKDLFGSHTPRLRYLELKGFPLALDSTLFSNLRRVNVGQFRLDSVESLRVMLSRNPKLVHLELDLEWQLPVDQPTKSPIISMNELSTFTIVCTILEKVLWLLSVMKIPPSVQINFRTRFSYGSRRLWDILAPHFAYALDAPGARMDYRYGVELTCIRVLSPTTTDPIFRLFLDDAGPHDLLSRRELDTINARDIPITFSLDHYASRNTPEPPISSILDKLHQLPTLDRLVLRVCYRDLDTLFEHLSCPLPAIDEGRPEEEWPCPRLVVIALATCRNYKASNVPRMLKARREAHDRAVEAPASQKKLIQGSRLVRPAIIEEVWVEDRQGSEMDEKTFAEIEALLGPGKAHWCWQEQCDSARCPRSWSASVNDAKIRFNGRRILQGYQAL